MASAGVAAHRSELQFREMARYYDLLNSNKDYRAEAAFLVRLARKFGNSAGRTWLDVACGTGGHLEHLRKTFDAVGVDLSPDMLAIARRRLPGVELHRGDMRTFDLKRRFDVVTCLFSAIGHLPSEVEVGRAFANLVRHLKPGGVILVEPWIHPDVFRAGYAHVVSSLTPGLAVTRVAYSRRRGHYSMIDWYYVVARQGRGIRHYRETNPGLLVAPNRLVELMRGAGARARFLRRGLPTGRGLVLGVRPADSKGR